MYVKCYISEKHCGNRFKVKLALYKPLYNKSTNAIKQTKAQKKIDYYLNYL